MPSVTTTIEVDIDEVLEEIEIECDCGYTVSWTRVGDSAIEVEPCSSCIEYAREQGEEQGYESGHEQGYEEGYEEGEQSQQIIVEEFKDA